METLMNYAWDEDIAMAMALGLNTITITWSITGLCYDTQPMHGPASEEEVAELKEWLRGMKTPILHKRVTYVEQLIERIIAEQGFLANCQYMRIAIACGISKIGALVSPPVAGGVSSTQQIP